MFWKGTIQFLPFFLREFYWMLLPYGNVQISYACTTNFGNTTVIHALLVTCKDMFACGWSLLNVFRMGCVCFVGYIQACRALMIIALILGLLAVILAAMGLKCTKLGSSSEESKGKISLTAGIMFLLSGQYNNTVWLKYQTYSHVHMFCLFSLSGLCVMVAVSWYAARIVQEFSDPFYGGTKWVKDEIIDLTL